MGLKKTLASLVLGGALSLGFSNNAKAQQFCSQVIDTGDIRTNPAICIAEYSDFEPGFGTKHEVWSNGNQLLYANSEDNFVNRRVIREGGSHYGNSVIDWGAGNNVSIAFTGYEDGWKTFYTQSEDFSIVQELPFGNSDKAISISCSKPFRRVYVAAPHFVGSESDIVLLYNEGNVGTPFTSRVLSKPGNQLNPVIRFFAANWAHLIYWDQSEGVQNGVGQYKLRSRSIEGIGGEPIVISDEETISSANQSYGADMALDSQGNVWVAYKDTTQTYPGQEFNSGIIWLADKNSGWQKRQVTNLIAYNQNNPVTIAMNWWGNPDTDIKHIFWSERDYDSLFGFGQELRLMYTNSANLENKILVDTSFNPSRGWVSMAARENIPFIAANIDPLKNYTFCPRSGVFTDVELQGRLEDTNPGVDGDVLNRLITFELFDASDPVNPAQTVKKVVTFPVDDNSLRHLAHVNFDVPEGNYTCLRARDHLHTLADVTPLDPIEGGYVARRVPFLEGGNLNDDRFIDILDFGSFTTRFGMNYGDGNTDENTRFYHADIDGNGFVFTGDFTFIQGNFRHRSKSNCLDSIADDDQPVNSISINDLRKRGNGELAAADINGDGFLDYKDIELFSAGTHISSNKIIIKK